MSSLEQTWQYIAPCLLKILGVDNPLDGVKADEFMSAYTVIYNYCVSRNKGPSQGSENQILLVGLDLYEKLRHFLTEYISGLAKEPQELFLEFYVRKWARFTIGARYLNNLFDYMNRYWVAKERSDGRKDIYDVNTLAFLTWRREMFDGHRDELVAQVLEQVRLYRTGQAALPALLQGAIRLFISLGFDTQELKKTNLTLYIDHFEKAFLESTARFYAEESAEYLASHNVGDYVRHCERRIDQEAAFADKFLDERSKRPLAETVCKALVEEHTSVLYEEFRALLSAEQVAETHRMYTLMTKVPGTLEQLAGHFEQFVHNEGLARVSAMPQDDLLRKSYIKTLIEVYAKFEKVAKEAFGNDPLFVKALDNACRSFINKNAVLMPPGVKNSRTPEYLAKYLDLLMRKNARGDDASSDMSEDDIMTVFRFLTDKDAFELFYRKLLAKRLIYRTSQSMAAEESLISKLTNENLAQYTSKLTKMFSDMKALTELQAAFRIYREKLSNKKDVLEDFSVFVLAETMWPFSEYKHDFKLPDELVPTKEALEALYGEKHTGRQLKWIWNLGRADIKATIGKPGKPPYLLTATTFQMAIILAYNDKDVYTFGELRERTRLPVEQLVGNLAPLLKYKLLSQSPPDPSLMGDEATKYTVVKEYKLKKVKVNFAVGIKIDQKHDLEETTKEIQQSRQMFLQACIVRIMKARKKLRHVMLVQEVIEQLHLRFKANMSDIKKAIEVLIEKEYLNRVDSDTYEYLA